MATRQQVPRRDNCGHEILGTGQDVSYELLQAAGPRPGAGGSGRLECLRCLIDRDVLSQIASVSAEPQNCAPAVADGLSRFLFFLEWQSRTRVTPWPKRRSPSPNIGEKKKKGYTENRSMRFNSTGAEIRALQMATIMTGFMSVVGCSGVFLSARALLKNQSLLKNKVELRMILFRTGCDFFIALALGLSLVMRDQEGTCYIEGLVCAPRRV